MGTSIKDILGGNTFAEPEEIRIIKNYMFEHFQSGCSVKITANTITIFTGSSALAGALRPHLIDLQKRCNTDKKLLIRIGK